MDVMITDEALSLLTYINYFGGNKEFYWGVSRLRKSGMVTKMNRRPTCESTIRIE